MRRRLLSETRPDAAVFVGGMAGIPAEMRLFNDLAPGRPTYPVGNPGGEAATLRRDTSGELAEPLRVGTVYPTLGRLIVDDIVRPDHLTDSVRRRPQSEARQRTTR